MTDTRTDNPNDTDSLIAALLAIMARLRDPDRGCPWDVAQSFETIAPYTIEEAYEVADAIARADLADLKAELGDLLLQVVFHARIAEEAGHFGFADVVAGLNAKLIRRHPHVFGSQAHAHAETAEAVPGLWERIKAEERAAKAAHGAASSKGLLDDVPLALPALMRAVKLQKRAARVGFDWADPQQVLAKVREECDELAAELRAGPEGDAADRISDELGDVLFAVANLARHCRTDPEAALRQTNEKFVRRFGFIERALQARGQSLEAASLDDMEVLWREAKAAERATK